MATALIPAALGAIGGISKLFGGIGGSSGQDPQKNNIRQQQLQEAEAAAMQGDPQAAAELASWNRPGPTNAEAQQFLAANPGLYGAGQGTSFSGNYGQFDNGQAPGMTGGSTLGSAMSPVSAGGSALGGILGSAAQGVAGLQAAQNLASQQAQLNASRAAAQNAYAQKAGIRGQALAGLSNSMTAPDLSSDFRSSNPFASQGASPYAGLANTQGAPVLYAGNAKSPAPYAGSTIPTPQPAIGGIANANSPMAPNSTSLRMVPGSVGGIAI